MLFDEIVNSAYTHREYPALDALSAEWRQSRPFEGLRVLVATPIFRNTLLEYRALLAGGAELVAGRAGGEGGTSMPCDAKIVDLLRESGIPLLTPAEVLAGESEGAFFDLILDCAGQFSACHPRHGFVELTRSAIAESLSVLKRALARARATLGRWSSLALRRGRRRGVRPRQQGYLFLEAARWGRESLCRAYVAGAR